MSQVLIIDNSRWLISAAARKIEAELNLKVKSVQSYSEAANLMNNEKSVFFVALVGLCLKDAPDGAIVDLVLSKNIPAIVFTGKFDDNIRNNILSRKIVDYVLKRDPHSLDYIISLIRRIKRNQSIKVLVADDSSIARENICGLLKVHQYKVFEASDGDEAYRILDENPDIKMVITDYYMPNMDGFELTKKIRRTFSKEELAIIGVSAWGYDRLSARFIKNGANDFMIKPFLIEEFYCRITQNIEMTEYVREAKEASNKDYLTGLYNRRYLLESGSKFHTRSGTEAFSAFSIAMIDIDDFRKINDMYGHDTGDSVIKKISMMLQERFGDSGVVSRFEGDAFCILISKDIKPKHILNTFEALRKDIEQSVMNTGYRNIHTAITVSIGVCAKRLGSLEMMLKQADIMLCEAKSAGRNRVMSLSDDGIMTQSNEAHSF